MSRALIADIIVHAAQLSGIARSEIVGRKRYKQISRVRQAAMLVASMQRQGDAKAYSYPMIARAFNRDCHSTVMHACTVARELMQHDLVYRSFVTSLIGLAANSAPFARPVQVTTAPRQKVTFRERPTFYIRPAKQWESIQLTGDHPLKLDEDGKTPQDHKFLAAMKRGSNRLVEAMLREKAA